MLGANVIIRNSLFGIRNCEAASSSPCAGGALHGITAGVGRAETRGQASGLMRR